MKSCKFCIYSQKVIFLKICMKANGNSIIRIMNNQTQKIIHTYVDTYICIILPKTLYSQLFNFEVLSTNVHTVWPRGFEFSGYALVANENHNCSGPNVSWTNKEYAIGIFIKLQEQLNDTLLERWKRQFLLKFSFNCKLSLWLESPLIPLKKNWKFCIAKLIGWSWFYKNWSW